MDLNARYEVQSVALFASSADSYPTYTAAHNFTVRITDIPATATSIDRRRDAPHGLLCLASGVVCGLG